MRAALTAAGALLCVTVLAACSGGAPATPVTASTNGGAGSGPPPPPPPPPPPGNPLPVAAWGDSTTSGVGAISGSSYPDQLQNLLGRSVFNGGVSGQTSDQIAARQGGAPAKLTLPGNTLPASGSVTIQDTSTFLISPEGPGPIAGSVAGVHGTLDLRVNPDNSWQLVFTRDASAAAQSVPAQTPFIPDTFGRESIINVFWMGGNNFYAPAQVKADIASSVAFLSTDHYLVLGVLNAPYEGRGTSVYDQKVQLNNEMAQAYPGHYLDMRGILISHYNPNDAHDVQDHGNDVVPFSLRNDNEHPNAAGYAIVAQSVYDFIQSKGW